MLPADIVIGELYVYHEAGGGTLVKVMDKTISHNSQWDKPQVNIKLLSICVVRPDALGSIQAGTAFEVGALIQSNGRVGPYSGWFLRTIQQFEDVSEWGRREGIARREVYQKAVTERTPVGSRVRIVTRDLFGNPAREYGRLGTLLERLTDHMDFGQVSIRLDGDENGACYFPREYEPLEFLPVDYSSIREIYAAYAKGRDAQ